MANHKKAFGSAGPAPGWYHGRMGRRESEERLKGTPDGTFLIRDSTSSDGDFVMSVSESTRVSHYIVQLSQEKGTYFIGDQEFVDLVQVLEFYKKHLLDTSVLTVPLPLNGMLKNGVLFENYIVTVKALYPFAARDPEDLSFNKGELLNIIEKHEDQWWRAQSQVTLQIGTIPVNYVQEVSRGPAAPPEVKPQPAMGKKPLQRSDSVMESAPAPPPARKAPPPLPEEPPAVPAPRVKAPAPAPAPPPARGTGKAPAPIPVDMPPERPKFIVAKAIMDRVANAYDSTALSFKVGNLIQVHRQNDNGLWEGEIVSGEGKGSGKRGHFPFTLVELMDSGEYDDDIALLERKFEHAMDEIYGSV